MPRYFFHVHDGQDFPDDEGTVLANPEAACAESMIAAAEMLRDAALSLWTGEEWTMHVVDEAGQPICDLKFSASIEIAAATVELTT
jgi:hypothetical protein